ncbi:hypothetical protein JYB32_15285, partial [Burkholderia cenocepacia]|uniref:hypothetical protein n=1 Tax=Burkholderia cenocepacia TaxID=95486 RepID=UPI00196B08F2
MDVHGGNVLPGRSVYAHKPEATIGRDEAPLTETTPESNLSAFLWARRLNNRLSARLRKSLAE